MPIYSFRAECQADVDRLQVQLDNVTTQYKLDVFPHGEGFPDVKVELTADLEQHEIESMMAGIVDSHVMYQSLRPIPLARNSLDRDYSRDWTQQ